MLPFKANLAMLQEARCLLTTAQACHINKSQWGVDNMQGEHLSVMTLSSFQLSANVLLVKLRNVNLLRSENRQILSCGVNISGRDQRHRYSRHSISMAFSPLQ